MVLDVRTLFITNFLYTFLIAFGFLISYQGFSGQIRSSLKNLSKGLLLMALGWLFLSLRQTIPDALSIFLGNLATLLGLSEIYQTIRIFDGKRPKRAFLYGITLLSIVIILFFYYGYQSVSIRIAIFSITACIIASHIAVALLLKPPFSSRIRYFSGISFVLLALIGLIRAFDALFIHTDIPSLLSNSILQSLFLTGVFLAIFMMSFAFNLMCTHRFNDELNKQAIIDPTTNLYNWIGLKQILEKSIAQAEICKEPLTIAIFDIDNFRIINKQYGVEAGDCGIKQIACYFQKYLRTTDILGRLGGDKFVLILPNTKYPEGYKIATDLKEKIDKSPLQINQASLNFTASFGVATLDAHQPNIDGLIRLAQQELQKTRTLSDDSYGT